MLKYQKVCDIKPKFLSHKVESSLLFFEPKKFFYFKNPKNLENTRVFFMHRRKMIKKPFNKLFNNNLELLSKLRINLNSRPQNLDFKTYYQLTKEYENSTS